MTKTTRFISSITKTAQEADIQMPWSRGARRAAFTEKRKTPQPSLKRA